MNAAVATAATAPRAGLYRLLLGVAFPVFGSLRLVSYLPTLQALHASGDTSAHSLWTWGIWLGGNLTMAAWLHEHNGRRVDRAVVLNLCNASMCAAAFALIGYVRLFG